MIGDAEGKIRKNGVKTIFKQIISTNFPDWQKAQSTGSGFLHIPSRINKKKSTSQLPRWKCRWQQEKS